MNHEQNQTHPARAASLAAAEKPDGMAPVPKRDLVRERREATARMIERCKTVTKDTDYNTMLKILFDARRSAVTTNEASFFSFIKGQHLTQEGEERRNTDIQACRRFRDAADGHIEDAQAFEKIAKPLWAEIERIEKLYKALNQEPPASEGR